MKVMFLALQSLQEMVAGRQVTALCNNSTVVTTSASRAERFPASSAHWPIAFCVDGEPRRPPRCEVSSRAVQCSGRSPQPAGSGYRDRVVSPPAGGKGSASLLGLTVSRSVRDESQLEASPIPVVPNLFSPQP